MSIIRQETNNGVIIDTKNDHLWVILYESCKSKEGCHTGCEGCSGNKHPHKKKVFVNNASLFSKGQNITLKYFILNENISAFLVFGIPLLLAATSAIAWSIYDSQKADSPLAIFTTGLAFIAGFFVVRIIDTQFRRYFPSTILPSSEINSGVSYEKEICS